MSSTLLRCDSSVVKSHFFSSVVLLVHVALFLCDGPANIKIDKLMRIIERSGDRRVDKYTRTSASE